jgi:hypothetical protein
MVTLYVGERAGFAARTEVAACGDVVRGRIGQSTCEVELRGACVDDEHTSGGGAGPQPGREAPQGRSRSGQQLCLLLCELLVGQQSVVAPLFD